MDSGSSESDPARYDALEPSLANARRRDDRLANIDPPETVRAAADGGGGGFLDVAGGGAPRPREDGPAAGSR